MSYFSAKKLMGTLYGNIVFFSAYFQIKIIYPRGIGPTYELYSSSRRTAVVPLLKNYMQFFLVIFLDWVMLPHPQATSTDHGGPRTSDLSIERRRRNHFTTAPQSYRTKVICEIFPEKFSHDS